MKKWGVRILSAFLTFTLGLCAAAIVRFRLAPGAKVKLAETGVSIKAQLPPLKLDEVKRHISQIAEGTQPTEEVDEIMQPHPVSISPYEIKRFIARHKNDCSESSFEDFWNRLGLDADSWIGGCEFDVEIFQLELDGKPGSEIMLRLYSKLSEKCRYLIFKPINIRRNLWNFLGYIDVDGQKYGVPWHRSLINGNKRWLVISELTGTGSGHSSHEDVLYLINESGVKDVFSYPSSCYWAESWTGVAQGFDSRILQAVSRNGTIIATVRLHRFYEAYENNQRIPLWSQNKIVTFRQRVRSEDFGFEQRSSDISREEFETVYLGDALSASDVLKYNHHQLARIAAGKESKRKEWLRKFLDHCNDSEEKQSLQEALEGAQP
jgi:hypothetical protein